MALRRKSGLGWWIHVVWYNEIKHFVLNLITVIKMCCLYILCTKNCPVKIKACMKWHPIALLGKQTRLNTSETRLVSQHHLSRFMYYLFLLRGWSDHRAAAVFNVIFYVIVMRSFPVHVFLGITILIACTGYWLLIWNYEVLSSFNLF